MVRTNCKLNPLALGLSLGIFWGFSVLILGLIAHFIDYGTAIVNSMGVLYVGYGPSLIGSILGGLMGFIDAFIGGYILAWLYNIFAKQNFTNTESTNRVKPIEEVKLGDRHTTPGKTKTADNPKVIAKPKTAAKPKTPKKTP
ncbi:MAG: bacteriophage holin [Tatlockia sp.]|nr:bacteriophage holin [Tatlockia sp.]